MKVITIRPGRLRHALGIDRPGSEQTEVWFVASRPRAAFARAALLAVLLCGQCGCVATKYQLARKGTPPVEVLNVDFPRAATLQATLVALISHGGPGSWKREALWDEYVVALRNNCEQPISLESVTLADSAGMPVAAGVDPWVLEKQSKRLEKRYRATGEAFVRAAGPGVLIVGAGAAAAAASTSWAYVAPGVAGATLATVFVLPVYYGSVLAIDQHNKHRVTAEFTQRRLPLPLILAPGETRTASVFYPMVRSPTALGLHWSSESGSREAVLPLDFLRALHVPAAQANTVARRTER